MELFLSSFLLGGPWIAVANFWFNEYELFMENVRFTTPTQQVHNTPSHEGGVQCWKMLDLQHQQHNKCTTLSHMRVGSNVWGPPSCEGVLCTCCDGVVQESNPIIYCLPSTNRTSPRFFSTKLYYQRIN
jgi:hypothetical protein